MHAACIVMRERLKCVGCQKLKLLHHDNLMTSNTRADWFQHEKREKNTAIDCESSSLLAGWSSWNWENFPKKLWNKMTMKLIVALDQVSAHLRLSHIAQHNLRKWTIQNAAHALLLSGCCAVKQSCISSWPTRKHNAMCVLDNKTSTNDDCHKQTSKQQSKKLSDTVLDVHARVVVKCSLCSNNVTAITTALKNKMRDVPNPSFLFVQQNMHDVCDLSFFKKIGHFLLLSKEHSLAFIVF